MARQEVNYALWENRYKALMTSIDDLSTFLRNSRNKTERQKLALLVDSLKAFAEGQFYFFWNGFQNETLTDPREAFGVDEDFHYKLIPSWEFHPDYVFEATLNQIEIDLSLFQRLAMQRIPNGKGYIDMKEILAHSELLAAKALQPVMKGHRGSDKLVPANVQTVTYFQKATEVRLIPYAAVALIGIPFTTRLANETDGAGPAATLQDYLSIAHEVGHYVYRQGRNPFDMRLDKAVSWVLASHEFPRWVMKWRGEIFADIYSCLVGGPLAALANQELALHSSRSPLGKRRPRLGENHTGHYQIYGEFTTDEGVHPVPFLRPFIYTYILQKYMGLDEWAEALKTHWITCLNDRFNLNGADDEFENDKNSIGVVAQELVENGTGYLKKERYHTFWLHNTNDEIDINQALKIVAQAIDLIIENCLPKLATNEAIRWSGDLSTQTPKSQDPISELYTDILPQRMQALIYGEELEEEDGQGNGRGVGPAPLYALDKLANKNAKLFWKKWVDRGCFFPGLGSDDDVTKPAGPHRFVPIDPGKADKIEEVVLEPMHNWMHVFHAGGWTTEVAAHLGG